MRLASRNITNNLLVQTKYTFAGLPFGKKREKVKNDLAKYDVVIVGGHLGALLSNHLDTAIGGKSSIFVSYEKPTYELPAIRPFYEKGLYLYFYLVKPSSRWRVQLKNHLANLLHTQRVKASVNSFPNKTLLFSEMVEKFNTINLLLQLD